MKRLFKPRSDFVPFDEVPVEPQREADPDLDCFSLNRFLCQAVDNRPEVHRLEVRETDLNRFELTGLWEEWEREGSAGLTSLDQFDVLQSSQLAQVVPIHGVSGTVDHSQVCQPK